MKIHKEGRASIFTITALNLSLALLSVYYLAYSTIFLMSTILACLLFLEILVVQFFTYSDRTIANQNSKVISPAQGKIVVIEEIHEHEYFEASMIQISIFMSIWDMHLNRVPINGKVIHQRHMLAKHLIARNPKSSSLNERNLVVFETEAGKKIMIRQIAGIVARRIVNYLKEGQYVKQGEQLGFIKFGSRVDIILPKSATINVKLGQKVKCGRTTIAEL